MKSDSFLVERKVQIMDETDVAVKLEVHEHEINSLNNQVSDLKEEYGIIQELAISVNKMAVNIENMIQEMNKQGERLKLLERVPVETSKQIKAALIIFYFVCLHSIEKRLFFI